MNERIKELEKQSLDYFWSLDDSVRTTDTFTANPEFTKKFAELIVRECANMCYKASQESFRLNEVKAGAMGMALKVLMEEHFGVEE